MLLAPLGLYRCSVFIYPPDTRSCIARWTVARDIDKSLAILRSDGQHWPSELARFRKYIYTEIALEGNPEL